MQNLSHSQNADSTLSVTIPWGSEALSKVANPDELELLSLQQHIIDDLQLKISGMMSRATAITAISNAEQESQSLSIQLKEALAYIELLCSKQEQGRSDSAAANQEIEDLKQQVEIAQLSIDGLKEQLSKQSQQSHDARADLATSQVLANDFESKFHVAMDKVGKRNRKISELEAELYQYKNTVTSTNKALRQAQEELAGVESRIANAVSAERARMQERFDAELRAEKEKGQAAGNKVASIVEHESRQRISSLERELELQKDSYDDLTATLLSCESYQNALNSYDLTLATVRKKFEAKHKEIEAHTADLEAQLTQAKRENIYLSAVLDFYCTNVVWSHEDGTYVFVLMHSNKAPYRTGWESEAHRNYPICVVMNPNNTAHKIAIHEESNALMVPVNEDEVCCFNHKHGKAIQAAMMAMPTKEYNDAVGASVKRNRLIAHNAEHLDINWSQTLKTGRFLSMAGGELLSDEDYKELSVMQVLMASFRGELVSKGKKAKRNVVRRKKARK
ncbi:hypothetical protein [Thaumasiovibrio sp. DFM-14]|uniref:hypothetical protein n=1 Tax=Thaumasiovibrio sp. DFM-14 TaxID=3384792 RepID=UPI0039A20464